MTQQGGQPEPGRSGPPDGPASWSTPDDPPPSWSTPDAPHAGPPVPPPGWGGPPPAGPGSRPGVVPLRPLGLGDLLDGAVQVVRSYWRPAFAAGAAVAVVGAALNLVVSLTVLRPLSQLDPAQVGTSLSGVVDVLGGALIVVFVAGAFASFSGQLLVGLIAPAVSRGTLGQPLSGREAWEQLRPRLGPLVGLSALVPTLVLVVVLLGLAAPAAVAVASPEAAVVVGLLTVPAAVIAATYLYIRWVFAPLCVVLERGSVRTALRRSGVLVRRSWWRVSGVLLLTALLAGVVSQVLQLPFLALRSDPIAALSGEDTSTSLFLLQAVGQAVSATVVGPFTAAVTGLLYVDRRMRAEGLDVALATAAAAPR